MRSDDRLGRLATGVCFVAVWAAAWAQGCGGGSRANSVPAITSLEVSCSVAQVQVGQTSQCSASVQGAGSFSTQVVWSVNGKAGGDATNGTISSSGVYRAPSAVPSPATVVVRATSMVDQTKSGAANLAVAAASIVSSVSVRCAVAQVQLNQTLSCSATVQGTGNFSSNVTWSVNGVAAGNSGLGAITASGLYTAPHQVPFPAAVRIGATSVADPTKSASFSVTVTQGSGAITLGGETLLYVMDSSVPPVAAGYIRKLMTDLVDQAAGDLYGQCGSAAAATTVTVRYDPALAAFRTRVDTTSGFNPITEINLLPNPDSSGIDKNFDRLFGHEVGLGLRVRSWAPPFAAAPQYGFVTGAPLADEQGFAEACSSFELKMLSESGRRIGENVNQGWDATLLVNSFFPFDSNASLGTFAYPGIASVPFVDGGAATYRLMVGPHGVSTLAAYEDSYFAVLTANQGPLSSDDRRGVFDSLAMIDGVTAGNWVAGRLGHLLGPVTPTTETVLVAWPNAPQAPTSLVVEAANITVNPDSTGSYAPITSGAVTINVFDVNGTQVLTLNSDLSQSSASGVALNLRGILPVGAYTVAVSMEMNCLTYSINVPVLVAPTEFQGSVTPEQASAPLIYGLTVDGSGNVTNRAITVTEGAVVYPTSGSPSGFVIVQAGASGEVTIDGASFTAPATGSRLVVLHPGL